MKLPAKPPAGETMGMGSELSMGARVEITQKYGRAYARASRKVRGGLLDVVVAVTGWSRDNARRRLSAAAKPGPRPLKKPLASRPRKFSFEATKVLQKVRAFSGGQCGKYLAVMMEELQDSLEHHGQLVFGKARYSPEVRAELLLMSPATIDRYLAPAKERDPLRGTPTKKPVDWKTDRNGRRSRVYDKPRTPFQKLLEAKVLSPVLERELHEYRDHLNPAELARRIQSLQGSSRSPGVRPRTWRPASRIHSPYTKRGVKLRKSS